MTQAAIDFKKAFIKVVQDGQRVFSHDRSKTLGASEAFGCLRRSYYAKFNPELADKPMSLGAAERGNIIENNYVVPVLRAIFGEASVKYAGEDQETLVSGLNSATPDALIIDAPFDSLTEYGIEDIGSNEYGIEIKSFDPRMDLREEKMVHRGQAIIQMGLFRELTKYKPNYVVILYVNAADFYDIRPFVVKYDADIYNNAKARAKALFEAKDPYELRPEGKFNGQCRYCPFQAACSDSDMNQFPTAKADINSNEEIALATLAAEYVKESAVKKAADEEQKRIGEDLKRLLNALGTKGAAVPGFSISYSKMDGRDTIDQDAMEADGIDLDKYKKTGKGYTRLTVTAKTDT